jgi:cell fate (sporulation/competence/biofilm development) regulator YlbF (YheA/YmcA/DUF963 family)
VSGNNALAARIDGLSSFSNTNAAQQSANIISLVTTFTTANSALSARIDGLSSFSNTNAAQQSANIISLVTTFTTANSALSARIDGLSSFSNTNAAQQSANIISLVATFTTSNSATATRIDGLSSYSNTNAASLGANIATLAATFTNANNSIALRIDGLSSFSNTNAAQQSANISTLATTVVSGNNALSARIDSLSSFSNTNAAQQSANIISLVTTFTTANSALATRIDGLSSFSNTNTRFLAANVSVLAGAFTSNTSSLATSISTLQSSLGSNAATITSAFSTANGIGANWAIQANVNSQTGGLSFTGIRAANGTGALYNLDIISNVNIFGNLLVSGTVDNPQLKDFSVTRSGYAQGLYDTGQVSLLIRKDSRVLVTVNFPVTDNTSASITELGPNYLNDNFLELYVGGDLVYKERMRPHYQWGRLQTYYYTDSEGYVYATAIGNNMWGWAPTTLQYLYAKTYGGRIDTASGTVTESAFYSVTSSYQVLRWFYIFYYETVTTTTNYKGINTADSLIDTPWIAPLTSTNFPNVTYTLSGSGSTIGSMKLYASSGTITGNSVNSVELLGSTNGSTYTLLATGSNLNYTAPGLSDGTPGTANTLTFNVGSTKYVAFRLVVKSIKNNTPSGTTVYVNLPEVEFYTAGAIAFSEEAVYTSFQAKLNVQSGLSSTITDPLNLYVVELSK